MLKGFVCLVSECMQQQERQYTFIFFTTQFSLGNAFQSSLLFNASQSY